MVNNLIKSKDVREYIEKIGYVFPDIDKAALITGRIYSLTRQNQKLTELEKATIDQKLKEKIHEKIERDNWYVKQIQTPGADELFMIEVPYEDDDDCKYREYFFNFDNALECALESGRDFYINKIKIHRGSVKWDDNELDDGVIGYLNYRAGEIYDYWFQKNDEDDTEEDMEEYDEEYDFEHKEICIPHQFKMADIIRVSGTDDYGIVNFDYENDLCEVEGIGKIYMSDSITVELVDEDMFFGHAHIDPDKLEYANLPDDHPLKEVLEMAGYVIKGRGYIQALQGACHNYLKKMNKKK